MPSASRIPASAPYQRAAATAEPRRAASWATVRSAAGTICWYPMSWMAVKASRSTVSARATSSRASSACARKTWARASPARLPRARHIASAASRRVDRQVVAPFVLRQLAEVAGQLGGADRVAELAEDRQGLGQSRLRPARRQTA